MSISDRYRRSAFAAALLILGTASIVRVESAKAQRDRPKPAQGTGRFRLAAPDLVAKGRITLPHVYNGMGCSGQNLSPALEWANAPKGTKSYAVTMYDPDAPTGSGFWHWAVAGIPATVTSLPEGAGDEAGSGLPESAYQLPTDAGAARFVGAAPPAGHGPHRYFITVHALDVEDIGVPATATPAFLGFNFLGHILGRATLVATAETPA